MASNYGNDLVSNNGLIFCWDPKDKNSFSGTGTTTYDIANNAPGNIGTMRLTGIESSSVDDGYVYFPGGAGGGYIDFREDSSDYTHIGAWTISAWVMRTVSLGPYNRVLGKQHSNSRCNFGVGMYFNKRGVIANDGAWRTVYDTGDDLVQDQWHHLVGSYNGSSAYTLYVDTETRFSGSAVTLNMTNAAAYPEAPLQIGTNYSGNELWKGNFGPCHVYNREITPDEVLQNFNAYRQRYGV